MSDEIKRFGLIFLAVIVFLSWTTGCSEDKPRESKPVVGSYPDPNETGLEDNINYWR